VEPEPQIAEATDDEVTWDNARKWLKCCTTVENGPSDEVLQQIHTNCHINLFGEKGRLPTRLVSVGNDSSEARLCITKEVASMCNQVEYATFTHCWGEEPMPLKTTRSNLDQMLLQIPMESLAKTMQDAILITRKLGFKYLWIDSICIVQDDIAEWTQESTLMGSIFALGTLNIVAAHSPDWSVGCFLQRDPSIGLGFQIVLPRKSEAVKYNVTNSASDWRLDKTTVSDRAWCFQETLLAPRSLYFCRDQLFWQCRHITANETFWHGIHAESPSLRSQVLALLHQKSSTTSMASTWGKLVFRYTKGTVTFWKDRLVAISGIARIFCEQNQLHNHTNSQGQHYLAGLWWADIELQLLWYRVGGPKEARARPAETFAPSWSWASVVGGIYLASYRPVDNNVNMNLSYRILDGQVTYATDDVYGPVVEGFLRIECNPLCPISLITENIASALRETSTSHYMRVQGCNVQSFPIMDTCPNETDNLFALHGCHTTTSSWNGTHTCLLLSSTGQLNAFRRVGFFTVDDSQCRDAFGEEFMSVSLEARKTIIEIV
jgi:hypothetical protein